jgi:hypothetical protein
MIILNFQLFPPNFHNLLFTFSLLFLIFLKIPSQRKQIHQTKAKVEGKEDRETQMSENQVTQRRLALKSIFHSPTAKTTKKFP